ncbi:DUF2796 domain-containing protein [Roseovarius sp. ZX-A-9]|uniref:DUF2796 domain-containing protein n=1 Tax=Roseovarius sp. ZX-A-9 TaxID=3014783 RepID=UPI00232C683F|nr:DUF2796 domain-containing protein [Roseovarius sp. ZX-A-9]
MKKTALVIALMAPSTLLAQQTRELGAHEHGHSALNIAIEGTQVLLELEAPGADIMGFEYRAHTQADRAKQDAAIAALSAPLSLFVLPAAAGCTVVEAHAHLVDEHHDHADGHDDHAKDDGAHHTEFHAEYLLNCTDPSAIDRIEFAYFQTFPKAREVDVQMISAKGAQGFEVERNAPVLDLSGLI